jgi:organic radical activating enzyme
MKTYRVNEIFLSLQGEGFHAGEAAVFLRFSGCNLKCPFCDTDFKAYREMDVTTIIDTIYEACGNNPLPSLCVITGGEPTLQLDIALIDAIHNTGMTICLETNGTKPVPPYIDFVTVSPKSPFTDGADVYIKECDEVKVVMTEDISVETIRSFEAIDAQYYFIQPCDTGFLATNKRIMQRAVEFVEKHPNWRMSLQQQKILKVR